MSRPRTLQEFIHWLEMGGGARGVALAAVLVGGLLLSLRVSWTQFHGATSETVLLQADVGRQLARGQGFTTQVNYPQTAAFMEARGQRFDAKQPYPELHQAPLYSLVIGGALAVLPERTREGLFAVAPVAPDGFRADYFLLGLNLALFWLAAWLTYDLGRRLFEPRVGWLAALGMMLSTPLWKQTVAINGLPLLMVLALLAFRLSWQLDQALAAERRRAALGWAAAVGAVCGLLFLTEYSAGALIFVALGFAAWRFSSSQRWVALTLIALAFAVVTGPWVARNLRLTGSPTGLAVQNVALKFGDPTAEPAKARTALAAKLPALDLNKLGNKTLTSLQENLGTRLWSGGALWFAAFFAAGWLYQFRSAEADRLRWTFTAALGVLVLVQAVCNSGESERLPVHYLAPVLMIFGAAFFFVLLGSNRVLAAWPAVAAAGLLALQALPLVHDIMEPRRVHFSYPPYFPGLLMSMGEELERRDPTGRYGIMADVPAGVAWYGDHRAWAQPEKLRDFYAITLEQSIGELLLTPQTLDRPFFSELAATQGEGADPRAAGVGRFGDWGRVYAGLFNGTMPRDFPLRNPQRLSENLYVLFDPLLPAPRGK